jgi:hypothetical protein
MEDANMSCRLDERVAHYVVELLDLGIDAA